MGKRTELVRAKRLSEQSDGFTDVPAPVQSAEGNNGLKYDRMTDTESSVYCPRHTAICMRIILSQGKVNIFNLAKNAGTSIEQIEGSYASNLPLAPELAKNLHSFGE